MWSPAFVAPRFTLVPLRMSSAVGALALLFQAGQPNVR